MDSILATVTPITDCRVYIEIFAHEISYEQRYPKESFTMCVLEKTKQYFYTNKVTLNAGANCLRLCETNR